MERMDTIMSVERVREHLDQWSRGGDILVMDASTATVQLAAEALGVIPARIAKTISLHGGDNALIIVVAGDAKIDNRKFRERFSFKPHMLSPQEALEYTGHPVGGVCPFALPKTVPVYLDQSLRRFSTVYPACGSGNSAIELTLQELEEFSAAKGWVDVCKGWCDDSEGTESTLSNC